MNITLDKTRKNKITILTYLLRESRIYVNFRHRTECRNIVHVLLIKEFVNLTISFFHCRY